jgi:putative ABC transport system permease protein
MPTSNPYRPPKLADRFLGWFCKNEILEEVKGDLHEFYLIEREEKTKRKANLVYWYHVLNFLRPFALKTKTQNLINTVMFKNNLKIASRVLRRNKFYSFLNLSGLSVGVACCLLIFLFVRDEYSFDKHHENHEQIFRVVTDFKVGEREILQPRAPAVLAKHVAASIPEVEYAGRIMAGSFTSVIDLGEKQLQIKNATYATSEILKIFTIPFVEGNPEGALDDPKTVVISESMAAHLFPNENAFGKTVAFNSDDFIIKGIFKDMPKNGHFKFDFIMSVMYQDSRFEMGWMDINSYTYLKLKEGSSKAVVEEKLNVALSSFVGPAIEETLGVAAGDININGNHARFYMQNLADIHLKSNFDREIMPNGSLATVRTILIIGVIILIIACINFVNLSTARAAIRSKEVGVRKVLGSKKKQLVIQFLFESSFYSVLSFIMATVIVLLALPYFNQLTGKEITAPFGGTPPLWLLMSGSSIVLGIVAGFYPAFVLSSFKPERTLKGQNQMNAKGGWLRSGLVVLQFSISTVLIITTLVVNNQLNFLDSKSLGFDKDKLITVDVMDLNRLGANKDVLKNELDKNPIFESYSLSGYVPVGGSRLEMFLKRRDESKFDESINSQAWPVEEDYISTMGMEIVSGSNFREELSSDSAVSIIINETAAKSLQLANPIGAKLAMKYKDNSWDVRVVGVVKDFHFDSMKENIKPLFLYKSQDPWTLTVRFNGTASKAMVALQDLWETHAGGQPFVANVVGEQYKNTYKSENQMKLMVNAFSVIAIIIAILGLFGLATFMAEQRKKEMGIRKVLGASAQVLFMNLLKKFTFLITIACLIAVPIAYVTTSNWLDAFAYRITLGPTFFIGASLMMLVMAWLTVSYQSLKVANRNPVENLRQD